MRRSLKTTLYLNVLAVNKSRAEELLPVFAHSDFPALLRRSDERNLSPRARECYDVDLFAEDLYSFVTRTPARGGRTLFV